MSSDFSGTALIQQKQTKHMNMCNFHFNELFEVVDTMLWLLCLSLVRHLIISMKWPVV